MQSIGSEEYRESDRVDLGRWWRQLKDPQLDRLIETSLAESLDLKLSKAKLRQARAYQDQAFSAFFPRVGVDINVLRADNADIVSPAPALTVYDSGFDASWELDIFGGSRRALEAATAQLDSYVAGLYSTQVSLVAEVAKNYIDLNLGQQRLRIVRNNIASQSEILQIAQWRYQAGLVRITDIDQANTILEQTRASIPGIETAIWAAENRLAILLGQNPGTLKPKLSDEAPFPQLPESIAIGIPSSVLTRRPDLVVAERNLAAETARVGQAIARRFPSFNIGALFGWQAYSTAALGSANTVFRAVSGTLGMTLFDGGALRSAVDIQSAIQEQALIVYQRSILIALEEVENALIAYALGRDRVSALQSAYGSAQDAAIQTKYLYQSGLSDFQAVLETERSRLIVADSLAVAQANTRTSLVALYKALGGGWEDEIQ